MVSDFALRFGLIVLLFTLYTVSCVDASVVSVCCYLCCCVFVFVIGVCAFIWFAIGCVVGLVIISLRLPCFRLVSVYCGGL